jgi:Na+-driven multidrug efflux pump
MAFGVNVVLIKISSRVVAPFGIYMRIQNFVFMPVFGVNNGVIAITAFNYGAKNKKRIDSVIKYGIFYAACIMLIGTALIEVFANHILIVFDASPDLMAIGTVAMPRQKQVQPFYFPFEDRYYSFSALIAALLLRHIYIKRVVSISKDIK